MSTLIASGVSDTEPRRSRDERSERARELLARAKVTPDDVHRRDLLAEVVLLHRDVAESVAARYRRRGVPEEDLCQAAYEGLVKAAQRFDPDLGHDFLSYAVPTMRGEVQRYFRDQGWVVRPPRRIQDLQWHLHQVTESMSQDHGREPSLREVVAELGVSEAELDEAMQAYGSFSPVSLDLPVGEDADHCLADLLPTDDPAFATVEARLAITPLLNGLSPRDRRILYLRFCEDRTQAEIGDEIGVTQMQVSRLLTRILSQLRCQLVAA